MRKFDSKIPLHHIKSMHQLSFRNINLQVYHQTEDKWFISGPKLGKEN